MKIVLFSRVPRWYSFKNDRLIDRLMRDGHDVSGVIVERTPTLKSLLEWKQKLGGDVFRRKVKKKMFPGRIAGRLSDPPRGPANSVKTFHVKSHNSETCAEILSRLDADLLVLRGCGIITQPILEIPKIGVINPHYAKLPDFRGMDVTEWSVLCGAQVAVCVHSVNAGVDTGVVLHSAVIEPDEDDTTGSLRDKSAALVVDLIAEAAMELANGKPLPQNEPEISARMQYFSMHERLKELANLRLRKFGGSERHGR